MGEFLKFLIGAVTAAVTFVGGYSLAKGQTITQARAWYISIDVVTLPDVDGMNLLESVHYTLRPFKTKAECEGFEIDDDFVTSLNEFIDYMRLKYGTPDPKNPQHMLPNKAVTVANLRCEQFVMPSTGA